MGCSRELYLCCLEYLVSTHIDLGFLILNDFLAKHLINTLQPSTEWTLSPFYRPFWHLLHIVQHVLSLPLVRYIYIYTREKKWLTVLGQCLNTLTDDNKDIYIEFQNHPEYTTTLLNLINDSSNTLVQVLACGMCIDAYKWPKSDTLL
jgi:hypothetical protein